ncbi:MAG: DNA mismatch repair endonuclease MutL [FCB group bacterium]|jgi:DNA mismatch repair protein MutL
MPETEKIIRKIEILPDFIANQIAAGEVVQRPESVVKELIENSLDAGADTFAVIVRDAGKQLIHVVDNGIGMTKEDLALACMRHATSKIFTSEDLENIKTYGFRGEALASISSVANIEIRTKRESDTHGWKLTVEPMKKENIEPCNTDNGTQVFVRNLFYNVPARRKFLRANLTEFRYIADTMMKYALIHPDKRFTFYDGDSLIFNVLPTSPERRITELLGEKTTNSLIRVELENDFIKIEGFVGQPHLAKMSRSAQYLYLNKRSIQSKSLNYAIYSAFEHLLEKNMHPLFMLNLELDPKLVDVNVHPQKLEVKFDDERVIFKQINNAVLQALQKHNIIPEIRIKEQTANSPFEKIEFSTDLKSSEVFLVNKETGEIIEPKFHDKSIPVGTRPGAGFNRPDNINFQRENFHQGNHQPVDISAFDALFGKDTQENKTENDTSQFLRPQDVPQHKKPDFMYWQLHNKYIFCQTQSGVMIIDQHAAHERVLYERAIKAMNREFSYSQNLLFKIKLKLNSTEFSIIKELKDDFTNLGYQFVLNEPDELLLEGVPLDVRTGDEESTFKELIEQFEENQKIEHTNKRDNLAATFSCKAAIKTGDELTNEEIRRLIKDLFECSMPYSCPHGRPTILEFNLQEFDKRFSRT